MLELYLNDYAKANKQSYKHNLGTAKRMIRFFGNCLLSDITPHQFELFRTHRLISVSKATVNRDTAFLRHVFTKAIEWSKWSGENPIKKIKPFKEERKLERYLTYEERQRLFQVSPDFLRPIILTGLKTGMRLSEILNLKWEDVDLHRGFIAVRHTKGKN